MRTYLSFGGGVNSVAMYLMLISQGWKPNDPEKGFEAVFVNHGTDWPETYEYVDMFKEKYPLTVIKPNVQGFDNLFRYCWATNSIPSYMWRWCTNKFKIKPIIKYYEKPCFNLLGIDWGERHRAKISTKNGIENRFPLIEQEIDRDGCKQIIQNHGLSLPIKSGCYICPFQSKKQFIELRRNHQCLFQEAAKLEDRHKRHRLKNNKKFSYICRNPKAPLSEVVDERQSKLWPEDEYPPCECML